MNSLIAIFLGGGAGALTRYYAVAGVGRLAGDVFPYGTLMVNVIGSLLIGLIMEASALKWNIPLEARALLITGFLGGFTTFSAFSMDFFKLTQTGHMLGAVSYAVASLLLSLAAVFGGVFIARGIFG